MRAKLNRVQVPAEHLEAAMLVRAVRLAEPTHPELGLFFAVPNGGHRSKAAAGKAKAEGVRPGVPDYLLPVRRAHAVGLAIELKRLDGGRLAPEQRAFLEALRAQGWQAEVCRGWEHAWAVLRDYLASDAANDGDER